MKIENNMNNIYSGFHYLLDESDADFITPFKRNNNHDMRLLHTIDYYFAENYPPHFTLFASAESVALRITIWTRSVSIAFVPLRPLNSYNHERVRNMRKCGGERKREREGNGEKERQSERGGENRQIERKK